MTKERIEKAIEVIKYAINNDLSLKQASIKCGYGDTYVKNTKADVLKLHEKGILNNELYDFFIESYNDYVIKNTSNSSNDKISSSNKKTSVKYKDNKNAEIEWNVAQNYPTDHIKTLDDLLKITDVDLDIWNVKDYIINKWDVTSWKSKQPETIQNFQVKARLERNVEAENFKNASDIFIELIKDYKPPILNVKAKKIDADENNLLEISIFDLHIGKLAWAGETGENYDVKIARERFLTSIGILLHRASGFCYSKILFPVGNDFFNSDNIFNTTTKGTPQDEDLRWQKTFTIGTQLLVDGINVLKQTGVPVEVIVIPGNHDFSRSYYMGSFLEAWFRDDNMVNINNGASPRKYYQHGKVLLGFTHGNEEKENSLPMIMANDIESKPLWSKTKFHEWHLGHQHRKKNIKFSVLDKAQLLSEDLGVTIRYLSSLSGTEEWHHRKGYIGSNKAADAFIWNDELGMIAHLNSNYND